MYTALRCTARRTIAFSLVLFALPAAAESGREAVEAAIDRGAIVNAHEHLQSASQVPVLLETMDALGIGRTVILGSSLFTFALDERIGFVRYDENNATILGLQSEHPDRIVAWPTLYPQDPEIAEKAAALHKAGAQGFKFYTGHGYIRRTDGSYFFHTMAMDDARLLPVYAYCEAEGLPLCMHINPARTGFLQEFIAVLEAHPKLKVNVPHFMLSTLTVSRIYEMLEVFPNIVCDISFGHDDYLQAGLRRLSANPERYRNVIRAFPDRFLFGTDLVYSRYNDRRAEWVEMRTETYYDLLTESRYTTALLPGEQLAGLDLPSEVVEGILYRNFDTWLARDARADSPRRAIRWERLGIWKINRQPGQAFPPRRWYR